jgi:hypothetical protein
LKIVILARREAKIDLNKRKFIHTILGMRESDRDGENAIEWCC